jgi:3-dehydroquinate synthase
MSAREDFLQSPGKSVMSAREDFLRKDSLRDLVVESAQVKLDIVAKDEREEGIRRHLNLGHTFAHAIEARGCDGLSHGEAVAVGLVAAAAAAVASGRMRPEQAVSIKQRVSEAGLPVALAAPVSAASLLEAARADKKGSRGTLRLVLPLASGGVEVVADEGGQLFMVGLAAIGAS